MDKEKVLDDIFFESGTPDFDVFEVIDSEKRSRNLGTDENELSRFMNLVEQVKEALDLKEKVDSENCGDTAMELSIQRQKNALLGEEKEVEYYKAKIRDILTNKGYLGAWYPSWYSSIDDAIFNEAYGFAGLAPWINSETEELAKSSSCKTIADKIYFKLNGRMVLQPQRISEERRQALKEALLLTDTRKNRAAPYFEVYLNNGSRVTIFNDNGVAKKGQDSIIFRKYHTDLFSLEEQANYHTIQEDSIEFMKALVHCGYNIAFTGPVCSAKTTMLATFQAYEDPSLQGILVETDPEIEMDKILDGPIMQLVPTEENMDNVIAQLKRSDAEYIVLGEARTGKMLNVVVEAANMGTCHCKYTFHNTETVDFCYDVAEKITRECGGNLGPTMIKVAKSTQFVINMCYLPQNPDQKRIKGIWEIRYDNENVQISMKQICKYDFENDSWLWADGLDQTKREMGLEQNEEAFFTLEKELARLAKNNPNLGKLEFIPPYIKVLGLGGDR